MNTPPLNKFEVGVSIVLLEHKIFFQFTSSPSRMFRVGSPLERYDRKGRKSLKKDEGQPSSFLVHPFY